MVGLAFHGGGDAVDELAGNQSHLAGPVLPVESVAHLLHQLGIDVLLPLAETYIKLPGYLRVRHILRNVLPQLVGGGVIVIRIVAGASHGHLGGFVAVELNAVDLGIEIVVVRAEGIQNLPHHLEPFVVVEGLLGGHSVGNDNRNDDVSIFLLALLSASEVAHHTPHTLHHIHLRVAGRHEEYGIEGGHVHALAQAAHIAQHAALGRVGRVLLEPVQQLIALAGIHGAINVACLHTHQLLPTVGRHVLVIFFGDERQHAGHIFGAVGHIIGANLLAESHGAAHQPGVGSHGASVVTLQQLAQAIDYAHKLGGLVGIDFLAVHILHEALHLLRDVALADGEHQHLVVGEEIVLHGVAEIDAEELLAINGGIVHGAEHAVVLLGLDHCGTLVEAGSGGHVEALVGPHHIVAVYLGKF